ncbi:ABC transporter permease/substrate-binding protein [Pseudoramibacter sp.]|jgi:osmoprotectant transport system permease protein|uniref:ABC transporter permease/substrate-binding protein n=1 Tax=Pseudoramibacter sp. TaxID=2034862 RepID=UPI0025EFC594|nr:glycine betaine ABC transporter substrate-binding protein [Pseudoramibacter sp.]MCH4071381.1 ABC transporter permease subunit [Pseudoramibacter sp.]MCH4105149.1 ABC transporter permease subunit [Pseudoramibacter sp.]
MISNLFQLLIKQRSFFVKLLLQHLQISFLAIAIAIVFGGTVGILISEYQKSARPTLGVINFLYTIPSISMLGFLIPFSGVGNTTAVIALTIYALLPMVRATHTGLSHIDPAILEAAKGMGSTQRQVLFKVKLPLAMPVILSGIRNMVTMTIALAGIASFIGAGGLGVAIYRGITTNNAAMTLAGSFLTALLALFVDFFISLLEKHLGQHHHSQKKPWKKRLFIVIIAAVIAAIVLAVLPKRQNDTIHIATKPMTEQYILGEMLDILIEHDTNLNVDLTQGVGGGTSNIEPGIVHGKFDLYPEYTGTGWNMVLKNKSVYSEDQFKTLQKAYNKKGLTWIGMYGFNNTYGLVVRKPIADRYHIKTYSDLRIHAQDLTFGAEYDFFERRDGYDALCKTYNMRFGKTMDMDIGLKYKALAENQIDVMVVFTTDGQLADANAVVLKDDKHFFPSYRCGNVVRTDVLDAHPELRGVLKKLSGQITDQDMVKMNNEVDVQKKEPRDVARAFLKSKGLL